MPIRPVLLLLAAWWSWSSGFAVAQPPAGPGIPGTTPHVSIVKQHTGEQALVVDYPWKVHDRPSVEVRLVTRHEAGRRDIRPLLFVKEFMKGTVTVNVYHCLDKAAGVPQRHGFTQKKIEFEILGRRNRLGRPSVCVARRIPDDDPAPGAAAVFCLLPSWSVDKGLLHLELPPQYFAEAGELYVWFLRHDKVLWEERTKWPGHDKPAVTSKEK